MSRNNPIPKPWRAIPNTDRNCVSLHFDKENRFFPTDRAVDFYMRGAVCWPATVGTGIDTATEGYLLVAGQELATKRIYIFEQTPFVCIDPITSPETGNIQYEGISQRLVIWWSRYYVDTFYWHDHMDTHNRYLRQLIHSEFLNPKPWFVEVIWHDEAQAQAALWQVITEERLRHWAGEMPDKGVMEPLYSALLILRDQGKVLPAAKAGMALAMGYEKFPWRSDA